LIPLDGIDGDPVTLLRFAPRNQVVSPVSYRSKEVATEVMWYGVNRSNIADRHLHCFLCKIAVVSDRKWLTQYGTQLHSAGISLDIFALPGI
jgi:hypothetical protein